MSNLEIIDLYDKYDNKKIDTFCNNTNSSLRIVTNSDSVNCNFEWLDMMEDTIQYLDNILRNPNRFIVNEEDIVKIELARRVTVESIKHLSRNTNLIQDYNKETGDVKPSKILNINKEESFDTYENRFIYSLIKNMKFYIERKKRNLVTTSSSKNNNKMEYTAKSSIGKENIDISMTINSKKMTEEDNKNDMGMSVLERIEKLELQIADLCSSSVYQTIDKMHISLVTSPIKKTNVILKNVNFQYALTLWNYLQTHLDDDVKREKKNKHFYDDGRFKKCVDESFLLNYLVLNSVNNNEVFNNKEELSEMIAGNMVEKIMSIDPDIDEKRLKDIIEKQYSVVKYKTVVNEKQIADTFKKYMNKYLKDVRELKL